MAVRMVTFLAVLAGHFLGEHPIAEVAVADFLGGGLRSSASSARGLLNRRNLSRWSERRSS